MLGMEQGMMRARQTLGWSLALVLVPVIAQAQPPAGAPDRGARVRAAPSGPAPATPAVPAAPEGIIVKPTPPPPPPPPPDPLAGMGGKVGAILDVTSKPHLLIFEDDHGVTDTRDLAVGDEYKEGWRLVSVSGNAFTMGKGKYTRQIALNLAAPRALPNFAAPVTAPGAAGGPGAGFPGRGGFGGRAGFGGGAGGPPAAPGAGVPAARFGGNIDPAQAAAMAGQLQGLMANLPPELMARALSDPRGASILGAIQSGNPADIGALVGQFQAGGAVPFILPRPGGGQ